MPADTPATAAVAEVVGEALGRAGRMLATSSRDWGLYGPDAWLWGLLCGWDCEDHDDVCGGDGFHGPDRRPARLDGRDRRPATPLPVSDRGVVRS